MKKLVLVVAVLCLASTAVMAGGTVPPDLGGTGGGPTGAPVPDAGATLVLLATATVGLAGLKRFVMKA